MCIDDAITESASRQAKDGIDHLAAEVCQLIQYACEEWGVGMPCTPAQIHDLVAPVEPDLAAAYRGRMVKCLVRLASPHGRPRR